MFVSNSLSVLSIYQIWFLKNNNFNHFLKSDFFQIVGITLLASFLITYVKIVSRNDKYASFKRNDLSFGMNLIVSTLFRFTIYAFNNSTELSDLNILNSSFIITFLFFSLWMVSTIVRKFGWRNENELNTLGIVFPNVIGIILLLIFFTLVK